MRSTLLIAFMTVLLTACSRTPVYTPAPEKGDTVAIPLSVVQEDRPVFFTFRAGDGKRINYFVLRKGGEVKSYLDACARCYPQKLGYRASEGRVVCRTCDVGYHNNDLKQGIGSCYPISLAGAADGPVYVIRKEDLRQGGRYF